MSSRVDVDAARERGWWITRMVRTDDGGWDVGVQFADGRALQLLLESQANLDLVIADAVQAHLDGDIRWHKFSEGGAPA